MVIFGEIELGWRRLKTVGRTTKNRRCTMRCVAVFLVAIIFGSATVGGGLGSGIALAAHSREVCVTNPPAGTARCHAIILTDSGEQPLSSGAPSGFSPANFKAAYNVQPRAAVT